MNPYTHVGDPNGITGSCGVSEMMKDNSLSFFLYGSVTLILNKQICEIQHFVQRINLAVPAISQAVSSPLCFYVHNLWIQVMTYFLFKVLMK